MVHAQNVITHLLQHRAMELLVDIGNTNLKWTLCIAEPHPILEPMRVLRHHGGLPLDLLAAWEGLVKPERTRVACVGAPKVAEGLSRVCRAQWGQEPEFAHPLPVCRGLTVAYVDPGRLGVDRWLAMLAAHRLLSQPVLILDAGTAITYDLLLADGRHLGGLILPGIETMRHALLANTQIPRVVPEEIADAWATDTATAIAVASLDAPAALAERLLRQLADVAGTKPVLLTTGGDAERLKARIQSSALHVPDLVLQGLALVPE
jgi:type III pantothenate kinase